MLRKKGARHPLIGAQHSHKQGNVVKRRQNKPGQAGWWGRHAKGVKAGRRAVHGPLQHRRRQHKRDISYTSPTLHHRIRRGSKPCESCGNGDNIREEVNTSSIHKHEYLVSRHNARLSSASHLGSFVHWPTLVCLQGSDLGSCGFGEKWLSSTEHSGKVALPCHVLGFGLARMIVQVKGATKKRNTKVMRILSHAFQKSQVRDLPPTPVLS